MTRRIAAPCALLLALAISVGTANAGAIASDLVLTKTDSADPVAVGDTFSYTISVQNVGLSAASGVVVTDTLPVGTGWILSDAPAFSGCTNPGLGNSGVVQCTLPTTLAAGATVTVTITVVVNAGAPALLSNTATVTTSGTLEVTPADNTDVETTAVAAPSADVAITKAAGAGPFTAGANIPYTITVTNNGPAAAAAVSMTDVIPAGSTFVSANSTQGSCSGTTTVVCSIGTLAAAGTATITLVVQSPATAGVLVNSASVSATTADADLSNNSATATVTTQPVAPSGDVPTLSGWMLILLAASLALAGVFVFKN